MKRNKHSLSHTNLLSCNMGNLIPITWMEVLPGDSFQQATSLLLRCSPLLTPVMHPVDVRIHHWFVPYRLIWDEFEDFITGGPDGNNASAFPVFNVTAVGGFAVGSLGDYLGIPTGVPGNVTPYTVSVLPFRAYNLIWNESYRDQDLETEVAISTASGTDATTSAALLRCDWEKDYFTSARPWAQKGPAVTIPIGTRANIKGIGIRTGSPGTGAGVTLRETDGTITTSTFGNDPAGSLGMRYTGTAPNVFPDFYADLSTASAITVTTLREALALQRYEEARARYGSRYVEYLRYLGVRSSDARLQRPEYLGGGRQTVQFSEVLQTAEGTDPVGDLKGHGIAAVRSNRYRRFFEEHGLIMTLLSVRPKTIYMDGLFRKWNRRAKDDFWQKEFEHIGQQEIQNKEVRLAHASRDGTFGWQDRYDEYRREESRVSGEFRSTLNMWHFARAFSSDPALNSTFVSCNPTENPFAVPSADVLWVHAKNSVQARRMVSKVGKSFIY